MSKTPFLYAFLRPIFSLILKFYFNLKTENKEVIPKSGSCVIAGNHMFYYDPVVVDYCTRRTCYALCYYTYYYAHEWFFKGVGAIPVEDGHGKDALVNAIDHLKKGDVINISPEGKMNKTDELLLPFKKGAVIMAKETNSPIIPYCIVGQYKFRSKNLKIVFGEPLDVSELSIEEANSLLYDTIRDLLIKNKV